MTDWHISRLNDRLTYRLNDKLTYRLIDRLTYRLNDRLTYRLNDRLTVWISGFLNHFPKYADFTGMSLKLGSHNAWYVFVVRHVWMCQKDSSNLTHTVCFDVSIYRSIGETDSTQIRHIFSYTRCANHDASCITNTNHASCGPSLRGSPQSLDSILTSRLK